MKPSLMIGDRWARIEVVKIVEQWMSEFDGSGSEESILRKVYVLQCDCGKLRKIAIVHWPGKRAIQDCGCGISARTEGKEPILVTMPSSMAIAAKLIAREKGNGLSQWVRDQIQKGIDEHKKGKGKEIVGS